MPTSTSETNKVIVIAKRKAVKELKAKHFNKTQVQKKLAVSPPFVRKWWDTEDIEIDHRGWPKGKPRNHLQGDADRVAFVRETLVKEKTIFYGPEAVLQRYQQEFPCFKPPSRSFVVRTLKTQGLSKRYRKRIKGGSIYQHYPAQSILNLGKIIQEADFTGKKTLQGHKEPLHFLARVYLKPFKLPKITRIPSPSGQAAANELASDWQVHPLPDVLKLDNDTAFYAAGRYANRWVSRFICWLLDLGISPVFSAFNKPWNNGSVEGINSVFVKKIWIQRHHETLTDLDSSIIQLNQEYADRAPSNFESGLQSGYSVDLKKVRLADNLDKPFVYFIRQVENVNEQACIRVLKVRIELPNSYLKQFVLAKLDVYQERLTIYYEIEPGKSQTVTSLKFPVRYY